MVAGHVPIVAAGADGCRSPGWPPPDRDAMTAGIPTPSYAAPQTSSPGAVCERRLDPGDPLEVADGVLRQGAAPARHHRIEQRRAQTGGVTQVHDRVLDEVAVVALQVGFLVVATDRAAQHRARRRAARPTCGCE